MFTRYPMLLKTHPTAFRESTPYAASFARRVAAKLRRWRERARLREDLRRLDERLLADIGLTVRAADLEATKPFWFD